jgi:hypothetical protein
VRERFGQAWRPTHFNCGIKEAPGTKDAPRQRQPKGCQIVASLQHALEIVAPGGDWKVLYKAWEG